MKKKKDAKKQSPLSSEPTGSPLEDGKSPTGEVRRAKALILSALTAGGVFQMNTWQAQAHGNRSSHGAAKFQSAYFSPEDYMVMRSAGTAPNTATTRELQQISSSLVAVQRRNNLSAAESQQMKTMQDRRAAIETQFRTQSDSMKALRFVRQGDTPGALASIEGQGAPDRVLDEYTWALLDVAYLNGGTAPSLTGPPNVAQFESIARPAIAYAEKTLAALPKTNLNAAQITTKSKCAEVIHNVASFLVLQNNPSAEQLRLAQSAADRALQIRQDLKQAPETMRSHWMVGEVQLKAKRMGPAEASFRTSLQQAKTLNDQSGVAWAEYSLGQALRASNPAEAGRLQTDARQIATRLKGRDTTMDFLLLQMGANG